MVFLGDRDDGGCFLKRDGIVACVRDNLQS